MKQLYKIAFFLSLSIFIFSRAFTAEKETIRAAIAANLSSVIIELKIDFESIHPETEIVPIVGSSGKLAAQIIAGAPFDVFLSADLDYPEKVFASGTAVSNPASYAGTVLLLFTTRNIPVSNGLSVLTNPGVHKIAIANPALAPHGRAAYKAVSNAGLLPLISNKIIYAENITATAQYVTTAAEVGFIPLPLLFDKDLAKFRKEGIFYQSVDPILYPEIRQGIVLLKRAEKSPGAKAFYEYILSDRAKEIFKRFGYN